jgi:hypothetical protein
MPEPTFILEDILIKEPGDITDPNEKKFLQEHKADLSPDEQTYYASVLELAPAPVAPGTPATGDPSTEFMPKFKDEAEFNAFIDKRVEEKAKALAAKPVATPPGEPGEGESGDLLKDLGVDLNFKFEKDPANWSEFAKQYTTQVFPQFVEALGKLNEKQRQAMISKIEAINQRFDDEIAEIRTKNPDIPKKDTKEGKEFEKALAKVAQKFKGVTSMHEAFEIYQVIPPKPEAEPPVAPPVTPPGQRPATFNPFTRKKALATNVPGSGHPATPGQQPKKYADTAGKSMDDIFSEATAELEKPE